MIATRCPHGRSSWAIYRCRRCALDAETSAGDTLTAEHRAWFERTGHCGGCGQPGNFCQCNPRQPCGCRDLHVMGSGIGVDPLTEFAAPVNDNQGELFAP